MIEAVESDEGLSLYMRLKERVHEISRKAFELRQLLGENERLRNEK